MTTPAARGPRLTCPSSNRLHNLRIIQISFAIKLIAAMALNAWTTGVLAHISLETGAAPAASRYQAVFQVSHGCQGQATTGVTVKIPAGFTHAKPLLKAGWTLAITHSALAAAHDRHGLRMTGDITAVTWTATSPAAALANAHGDGFVLRGQLPDTAGLLWFAVQQRCDAVVQDWSEIPASGTATQGLQRPAALLVVTPAGAVQPFGPPAAPTADATSVGMDHSAH